MPTNPALSNLSAALDAYTSETPTLEQEDPHAQTLVRAVRAVLLGVERGEVVGLPPAVTRDDVAELADRVAANYTAGGQRPEPAAAFLTEALASSFLRHQVQNATIDTDRLLRRVVAEAAGYAHQLVEHATLPDPFSRQTIDSAAQELRVLASRVNGLSDATVHAAYLGRHDAPAVPEGHMVVDVELLAQTLTDAAREQADPVARVRRLVLGIDTPTEG